MTTHILPALVWRKSTRSSGGANNCVEVGFASVVVGVRDTKDREGGVLAVSRGSWGDFVAGLKRGVFDLR